MARVPPRVDDADRAELAERIGKGAIKFGVGVVVTARAVQAIRSEAENAGRDAGRRAAKDAAREEVSKHEFEEHRSAI